MRDKILKDILAALEHAENVNEAAHSSKDGELSLAAAEAAVHIREAVRIYELVLYGPL